MLVTLRVKVSQGLTNTQDLKITEEKFILSLF